MRRGDGLQISVITPYNGSGMIGAFVRCLANQSLEAQDYELLIGCEAGVEPDLDNLLGLPFAVRVVPAPRPEVREFHTGGRLRNAAIRQARGARLVFIDSDCLASPTCLARHAEADRETAVCGTKLEVLYSRTPAEGGRQLFENLRARSCPDTRVTRQGEPARGRGSWGDFWTCNASAATDLVTAAGLFDEKGFRCHDLDLGYRLLSRGARFRLDPECQVLHIEHGRSIWLKRAQIAGLSWLARKHPEIEYAADNLAAVFRNAFHNNLLESELQFTNLTALLPGLRAGLSWVTPCGFPLPDVLSTFPDVPRIVHRLEHSVQVFLRLAELCWDYSVIVPNPEVLDHPMFSVVVLPTSDKADLALTVESLVSQTYQSFEIVLTETADTAARLRGALTFSACGRVRTHLAPPEAAPAGIVEHVRPLCRGDYLVQLEVGGWLREDLLADMARSIPMIHGGVVAELCGSGGDWSLATLDRDEPSVGSGAGGGGIRVYHIGHLPAEANRPTGFLPPAKEGGHPPDAWARAPAAGDIAVVADGAAAPLTTTPASGPQRPEREICDPSICAFTFDSGPHPTLTHRVLDALDETGMKGSFFLVGSQAKRCPEVVRRIVASGHEVAVQGYDYEDLSRCTYSTVAISIEKTIALICDVAGVMPRWFRPPFARCSALVREVCRLKALKPVGWHISSGDWTRQHHHRTVSTVLAHGMEGAVVLFHDGCGDPWQTAQAVSALGCIARANGTAGVTLTDLESLVSLPPLDPSESITTSAGYYA